MTSWIWTLPDRQGSPEPWSSVGAKCNSWRHSTFFGWGFPSFPPSCSFFPILLHSSIQQPSKLVLLCTRLNTRVGNSTDQFLQRLASNFLAHCREEKGQTEFSLVCGQNLLLQLPATHKCLLPYFSPLAFMLDWIYNSVKTTTQLHTTMFGI